ncbi:undecaprenyl-diphosphate phosphatase [Hymenobacter koreensis]|uniref:Undecaprenyl-diphosphatase n=1 Tax=Hymenobacter koreensis TaxID=1084523 RepID=A0ABP8IV68_9BACT
MSYWHAFLLAIVEGLTEFLPVSSTGHMIIASALVGIEPTPFTKLYSVVIQLGAIASVFVVYWRRFFQSVNFYLKLIVGSLPVIVVGLALDDFIDQLLGSVAVIATALLLGGIVLTFIDKWLPQTPSEEGGHPVTTPSYRQSFIIGVFQCLAVLLPGTSRSAATIIGGLTQRLTRQSAAEFSFFLALPAMAGATVLKVYKNFHLIRTEDIKIILFGNAVAFIVALLAIRLFVGFVSRYGFRVFGIYRIIVGGILLLMLALGIDLRLI